MSLYYTNTVDETSSNWPLSFGVNRILETKFVPYATITDVEDWIHRYDLDLGNNTPEDYEKWVSRAIQRAARGIDTITMTTFNLTKRLEWHDGTGEPNMMLDCYPIVSLENVTIFSAGFQAFFEYEGDTMIVDNEAGSVAFPALYYTTSSLITPPFSAVGYVFLPGRKNCRFEYWYGFDGVPDTGFYAGIRDACAMWAAALLLSEADVRLSQGMMSLNVEGQGQQYGRFEMQSQKYMAEAKQMALRFRRQVIGGLPI